MPKTLDQLKKDFRCNSKRNERWRENEELDKRNGRRANEGKFHIARLDRLTKTTARIIFLWGGRAGVRVCRGYCSLMPETMQMKAEVGRAKTLCWCIL